MLLKRQAGFRFGQRGRARSAGRRVRIELKLPMPRMHEIDYRF
jgi:hypothetical protein